MLPCSNKHWSELRPLGSDINDILVLQMTTGECVRLLPLAIGAIVEETPGVYRFQIVQTTPTSVQVRLTVQTGAEEAQV